MKQSAIHSLARGLWTLPGHRSRRRSARKGERGWALLGLLLALTIIAIALVAVAPSVQMEVRRDKEDEMIFRGQEMAEAIARYYNFGRLGPINIATPPPYGYLTDLDKLRDGFTMGVTDLKFARPSALIDPMTGQEWVPVRARDKRLMPALQAYAAANMTTIPPVYMLLAAAPVKTQTLNSADAGLGGSDQSGQSGFGQQGAFGQGGIGAGSGFGAGQSPQIGQGAIAGGPPGAGQRSTNAQNADNNGDDDDDDDMGGVIDPLAGLLKGDPSNLPIVGVAPNLKGASVHSLWGLTRYQDWVFIYLPPQQAQFGVPVSGQPIQQIGPGQGSGGGQVPKIRP